MNSQTHTLAPAELLYFVEHGAGPPLLLVHGLMATGEMFDPLIEHLATQYRVIVPDLRGHGRSRMLPPPYTVAQLALDLSRLLDHLGIGSAAVLGYSHGGAIAQQLALDDPDRCGRLVLACTYAFNMVSVREKLDGHLVPVIIRLFGMRRFAKLVIARGLGQVGKSRAEWVTAMIATQDGRLMMSAWKDPMAFDSRPRLAEINCPTLVVTAANDRAVPIHHAHQLTDGIPASRLVIVDGADHALVWTHPGELGRLVVNEIRSP